MGVKNTDHISYAISSFPHSGAFAKMLILSVNRCFHISSDGFHRLHPMLPAISPTAHILELFDHICLIVFILTILVVIIRFSTKMSEKIFISPLYELSYFLIASSVILGCSIIILMRRIFSERIVEIYIIPSQRSPGKLLCEAENDGKKFIIFSHW